MDSSCPCPMCSPANPDVLYTEEFRAACEARYVLGLDRDARVAYCKGVADQRGRPVAVKLWEDAKRERIENAQRQQGMFP